MFPFKETFFGDVSVHSLGLKVCNPCFLWVKQQVFLVLGLLTIPIDYFPHLKGSVGVHVTLSLQACFGFGNHV